MSTTKPMYLQIADNICEAILLGALKPFEQIPSESALGDQYNVSRLTARKAMEILERDGFIITEAGKGSFVREISKDNFKIEVDRQKLSGTKTDRIYVLDVAIIESTKELVYKLQVPPTTRIIVIERLMYQGERIISYDVKYIPYYTKIPLTEDNLESPDFEQIIQDRTCLYSLDKELLIYAETADIKVAGHMKVDVGYPLMILDETLNDADAGVLGWGKTYYAYDILSISGEMIRNKQ